VARLARAHDVVQRAHRFLDGRVHVEEMQYVDIDVIHAFADIQLLFSALM
jgi:hypothetical protein